jgi:hypothetical protein
MGLSPLNTSRTVIRTVLRCYLLTLSRGVLRTAFAMRPARGFRDVIVRLAQEMWRCLPGAYPTFFGLTDFKLTN